MTNMQLLFLNMFFYVDVTMRSALAWPLAFPLGSHEETMRSKASAGQDGSSLLTNARRKCKGVSKTPAPKRRGLATLDEEPVRERVRESTRPMDMLP